MTVPDFEYVPLKFAISNREAILQELEPLKSKMTGLHVGSKWYRERRNYPPLAPDVDYERVNLLDDKTKKPVDRENGFFSWHGINLTRSETFLKSESLNFRARQEMKQQKFEWNSAFHLNETQKLIDSLCPTEILMCRLMVMEPNSFGPFHTDVGALWDDGYLQINLTLQSGGSPLMIKVGNRYVESYAECFMFKDHNPHGVPQVRSARSILVVVGKFQPERILSLMDLPNLVRFEDVEPLRSENIFK